jgi:hypothetical protein
LLKKLIQPDGGWLVGWLVGLIKGDQLAVGLILQHDRATYRRLFFRQMPSNSRVSASVFNRPFWVVCSATKFNRIARFNLSRAIYLVIINRRLWIIK